MTDLLTGFLLGVLTNAVVLLISYRIHAQTDKVGRLQQLRRERRERLRSLLAPMVSAGVDSIAVRALSQDAAARADQIVKEVEEAGARQRPLLRLEIGGDELIRAYKSVETAAQLLKYASDTIEQAKHAGHQIAALHRDRYSSTSARLWEVTGEFQRLAKDYLTALDQPASIGRFGLAREPMPRRFKFEIVAPGVVAPKPNRRERLRRFMVGYDDQMGNPHGPIWSGRGRVARRRRRAVPPKQP
jgi:hypothetical protein